MIFQTKIFFPKKKPFKQKQILTKEKYFNQNEFPNKSFQKKSNFLNKKL